MKLNRIMYSTIVFATLVILGGGSFDNIFADTATSPLEQLRPTINKMIQTLDDPALQGDEKRLERRAKIMVAAHERFDFAEMSKRVLGKAWRKRSVEEKRYFEQIFTQLLEHAYIGKLEGYSGRKVIFKNQRVKGKRAVVQTIVPNNENEIPVQYVMIAKDGNWMVYDIVIEGVSLLRNYIEQFKTILRQDKYAGLVKQIEEKNTQLAKKMTK